MINLDYLCIKYGQIIGETQDKSILQKALGVLREDGIYAMLLWIENKAKETNQDLIGLLNKEEIKRYLLQDSNNFPENDFKGFCERLQTVAQDIDKLFFLKKVLERTLTYAFYHAKIRSDKDVEKA